MLLPWMLVQAVDRVRGEKSVMRAGQWVYRMSTREDRLQFDAWLVAVNHPLAFIPATAETRFMLSVAEAYTGTRSGTMEYDAARNGWNKAA